MNKLEVHDVDPLETILYLNVNYHDDMTKFLKSIVEYEIDDYDLKMIFNRIRIYDPRIKEFMKINNYFVDYLGNCSIPVRKELINLSSSRLFEDIEKMCEALDKEDRDDYLKILYRNISDLNECGIREFRYNPELSCSLDKWVIYETSNNELTAMISDLCYQTELPFRDELDKKRDSWDYSSQAFNISEGQFHEKSFTKRMH